MSDIRTEAHLNLNAGDFNDLDAALSWAVQMLYLTAFGFATDCSIGAECNYPEVHERANQIIRARLDSTP